MATTMAEMVPVSKRALEPTDIKIEETVFVSCWENAMRATTMAAMAHVSINPDVHHLTPRMKMVRVFYVQRAG